MNVSAEIRDFKKLHRIIAGLVAAVAVPLILWIVSIVLTVYVNRMWLIPSIVLLLVMAAAVVAAAVVAAKGYHKSWKTELFELLAQDGCLTFKGQKLHTNYNKKSDCIYVHDMVDAGNPVKASIYLTVFGEDKDRLMEYIRDHNVKLEEESVPKGRGKYAAVTNMNLGVSKYRRR